MIAPEDRPTGVTTGLRKVHADTNSTGSCRWSQASDSEPSTELKIAVAVLRLSSACKDQFRVLACKQRKVIDDDDDDLRGVPGNRQSECRACFASQANCLLVEFNQLACVAWLNLGCRQFWLQYCTSLYCTNQLLLFYDIVINIYICTVFHEKQPILFSCTTLRSINRFEWKFKTL